MPQVRLAGIDCPEMRGKSEKEKKMAIKARDMLRDNILGRIISTLLERSRTLRFMTELLGRNDV